VIFAALVVNRRHDDGAEDHPKLPSM